MSTSNSIRVKIWAREGCSDGTLNIDSKGMSIKINSGKNVRAKDKEQIYYEMNVQILPDARGRIQIDTLKDSMRILLRPFLMIYRPYNPQGGQYIEDVFPPSTSNFYGRMQQGKEKFLYIVQEIENDSRYWLTVANDKTGQIFEAHMIFPYEAEALSLVANQEFREQWFDNLAQRISFTDRAHVTEILDSESVDWISLSKILGDVDVPIRKTGGTMRETLSQLIPQSFPSEFKEQLMLFLTYVLKKGIPDEDPINYLYNFRAFPIFESLLTGHLMYLVDGVEWPPYLKLMTLAEKKHLIEPKRTTDKSIQFSPWLLFWQKATEQFQDWFGLAAEIVRKLNDQGKVISKLPITQEAAKKSLTAWKKRLSIFAYELRIIGRVNPESIGLSELVYLGSAYRWPNKHMRFITQLGARGDSSPYLQVMVMPPSAAERIKRVLPSAMSIDWGTRTSNISLFNAKKNTWKIPTELILRSMMESSSLRKIRDKYDTKNIVNYQINEEEAIALDLASDGISLVGIEKKDYIAPLGLDWNQIQSLLTNLSAKDVIQLFYETSDQKLISLATIVQGPIENVTSLCSAFLEYTPTTTAMIGNNGEQAILLSKLPEYPAYDLVSQLPKIGLEQDLIIRCLRPSKFQSFTHNLYHRLLKDDGTWNDDVSAFLSQARSKRRELSESNIEDLK